MTYHILNGDCLVERFLKTTLDGQLVVMRECLVVGNLGGDSLEEFYQIRAEYLATTTEEYFQKVQHEITTLLDAPKNSDFYLWFGYDLFCQANLWFLLSLLNHHQMAGNTFVVYPTYLPADKVWNDFGEATVNDLLYCYTNKRLLTDHDLRLASNVWDAYKHHRLEELQHLSTIQSPAFPYLQEVCQAHIERFTYHHNKSKPEVVLEDILQHTTDFYEVFEEFSNREPIYGFGDTQVKYLYDKLLDNH